MKRNLTLTTPRLVLRELHPADWSAVWHYQSKPAYLRYYPWKDRSPEAVQTFLQQFIDWRANEPDAKVQLAVTLKTSGQMIGLCGLRKTEATAAEGEIGYEIDPAHWGQGLATEAARSVLNFAFAQQRLHRVWATCVPENSGSVRVLEKLGLRLEGRLRENRWMKERWWDTLIYAVLEDEWRQKIA